LAALAFCLSAFSALAAFFAALPFPALAVAGFAASADELAVRLAAERTAPDPAAVARAAPFRAVVEAVFAVVALDGVEPLARAGDALLAVLAAVVLAAVPDAARCPVARGAALAPVVLAGVVLAGAAERALAASLSDVTAVSSALVADEIAVSALVSVFADVAA
jgi:hypothetical protein